MSRASLRGVVRDGLVAIIKQAADVREQRRTPANQFCSIPPAHLRFVMGESFADGGEVFVDRGEMGLQLRDEKPQSFAANPQ
jgi:hypothetical protein